MTGAARASCGRDERRERCPRGEVGARAPRGLEASTKDSHSQEPGRHDWPQEGEGRAIRAIASCSVLAKQAATLGPSPPHSQVRVKGYPKICSQATSPNTGFLSAALQHSAVV